MKKLRIAIGQISSESNHFTQGFADVDFFRHTGYLHEGSDVLKLAESDTEVGGFIETLRRAGNVEIVPLLATRGNSGPPLSADCYAYLRGRMLTLLKDAGPVDGVLISQHGSMCVENEDDPEGDLAVAIREMIGPDAALGLVYDMHANVSPRRVESANIIVAYEHYPHDDARRTGERGATLILRTLAGEIRPVMVQARLPMLLTGFNAGTSGNGPFARLMNEAKALDGRGRVLSTAVFLVGSYIDVPVMCSSTLVMTDGDAALAKQHAEKLARTYWSWRSEFEADVMPVAEAIRRGRAIDGGPVLLLDTADTTGGGAAGDSIAMVKGLIEGNASEPAIAMVIDPEAATACHRANVGDSFTLDIGHKIDRRWGKPLRVTATLVRKSDGQFRYSGGVFGGTTSCMGPSAVLKIGSIHLLVMSYPTYDWAYEQYESVGLDPRAAKFVGVKNMMNFRRGYADIMKAFFVCALPGPTPIDYRTLPYQRVRRPIYPLDELPGEARITFAQSRTK